MSRPFPEPTSHIHSAIRVASHSTPFISSALSVEESEQMRTEYLSMIVHDDWWDRFQRHIPADLEPCQTRSVQVSCSAIPDDVAMTFPFFVGRFTSDTTQHVQLPVDNTSVSRCHFICVASGRELLIIDVGSYAGIVTLKRSGEFPVESSLPRDRRVLKFSVDERFVLKIGDITIGFNLPKAPCLVCMDRPRHQRLVCGHMCCCSQCLTRLRTCPICRAPITGQLLSTTLRSYARQDAEDPPSSSHQAAR